METTKSTENTESEGKDREAGFGEAVGSALDRWMAEEGPRSIYRHADGRITARLGSGQYRDQHRLIAKDWDGFKDMLEMVYETWDRCREFSLQNDRSEEPSE